ncbi:MAG: 4Fe-4S dicluster domain-containing protein [Candidatus Latescibacterota bacterium]
MIVVAAEKLGDVAAAWAAAGYRVIAPVRRGALLRLDTWAPAQQILLDEVPVNSVKDAVFPPTEVIGRAGLEGDDFSLLKVEPEAPRTVVLGVRPCDAAALAVLDRVFTWDCEDVFYTARRAATTVVSLACSRADEHCFCTSVGVSPGATTNADACLRPANGSTRYIVEPLTRRGEALVQAAGYALQEGAATADPVAQAAPFLDSAAVTGWLAGHFDHPVWQEMSLACLGCGACAFACPGCHCFDIQDDASRTRAVRRRNWDTCALGLFTLHASGHNPRGDQAARWRQRVMHKFRYLPERFGLLGCTGCGRCSRLCPNGLSMADACRHVALLAAQEGRVR